MFDTERAHRNGIEAAQLLRGVGIEPMAALVSSLMRLDSRVAKLLAVSLCLLFAPPFAVAAGLRSYRNDALKVRAFEPPVGWEAQTAGSYPRLLAAYEDKSGARLTLVAQRVAPGTTARALSDESRPALERQGFRSIVVTLEHAPDGPEDAPPRVRLEASLDGGRRFVRQLYVVDEGIGYVMTLVGPATRSYSLRRDFDEAAQSLQVGDNPAATAPPPR
jgi:hypothetical protein